MKSDLYDVEVIYQTRTPVGGVCVREAEDGPDIWLPASQVQIAPGDADLFSRGAPRRGGLAILTAPEWLLREKGLI